MDSDDDFMSGASSDLMQDDSDLESNEGELFHHDDEALAVPDTVDSAILWHTSLSMVSNLLTV